MAERSLVLRLRAAVGEFKRDMDSAADSVGKVGQKAQETSQRSRGTFSSLAQHARDNREAWTQVGGALTTYGAAVTGLGSAVLGVGISYNTLRQRSVAALTTLTGSAEKANAQMDKLDEFASTSPFARDVFIKAQQQLIGFGMEAERVIPALDAIQNAVAATGGSNHDIEELVRIIAQVGAAGKITATDLMQFGQRGVDAATLIGSQMGKTGAQIREEITAGTLGADEAIEALVSGMDQRFGGAAANVKDTMDGAVDRVKAAFRDISASFASVLVDPQGGGLLVDGLNAVADAMRWFEDLPEPIRNTATGLGLLTGPLALAAGGFLLLAPRLVDTWDALSKMGRFGDIAQRSLKGLGRAVGAGSVLLVGLGALGAVLGAIRDATTEAVPGVEKFTSALLDLGESRSMESLNRMLADLNIEVNGLSGMVEGPLTSFEDVLLRLGDPTLIQRLEGLDKVVSFGQLRTSGDDAADVLDRIDDALAGMVTSGNGEEAARIFEELRSRAAAIGQESEFEARMDGYQEALAGLENEARLAEGAVDDLGGAFVRLPEGEFDKKAQALYESAQTALQGFIDLSTGIDDAGVSFEEWIRSLEEQAAAQEQWAENMATLARAGVEDGFLAELEKLGPQGALRVQQAVDAIADDPTVVERMNELGSAMGGATADSLAEEIRNAQMPEIEVSANTEKAFEFTQEFFERTEESTATTTVDADTGPAENKTGIFLDRADNSTGTPNLDLYVNPATGKLESFKTTANNTTVEPRMGLITSGASITRDNWLATTSRMSANVLIGATVLQSAYDKVRGFLSWAGSRSTSVTVSSGVSQYRAEGGPVFGPGTGTSDSIAALGPGGSAYRLSNGEHVWTAREVAALGGHAEMYRLRKAVLANAVGYAGGGAVGPTPVAPTSLSIDYDRLALATAQASAQAFMSAGLKVELDRREMGRLVGRNVMRGQ